MWVYCQALYSVALIHMSVSVPVPCCFDYCNFVVLSEVWEGYASIFVLFPQVLWFHVNFRIICSSSVKSVMGNLIGIALNLQIALGSIAILTILILPIQEHGIFSHFFKSSSISFINVSQFSACKSFASLVRFIPKRCFFFLDAILFYKFLFLFILFLAVLGLRCCVQFSLVAASRGYSSLWCTSFSLRWLLLLWSTGSRCAGFSSCGTWAQQLWCMGLVAPRHVGSSRIRARTHVPCISRRILNYCATREALDAILKGSVFLLSLSDISLLV